MIKLRKKYLRKKYELSYKQLDYILLEASNLNASKLQEVHHCIKDSKLYCTPSYTLPPKLGAGCSLIRLVSDTTAVMESSVDKIPSQLLCLGICIETKWYAGYLLEKNKTKNLKEKLLSFLLKRKQDLLLNEKTPKTK